MRRNLLCAIAMAAAMACSAAPAAAQTAQDSVTGSGAGTYIFDFISLSVDASSGPSGENARGTVDVSRNGTLIFSGPVTTLTVNGHTASVESVDSSGAFLNLFIVDRPTGDEVVLACGAPGCFPPAFFDFTLSSGNFVVHDAPPLPTSKDQCKNGGWREFGFKNQGQCVASVERRPNP
jgi:hypothetical protein